MYEDPVGIGIEGTFAPQLNRDTLEVTGHYERWRDDFRLITDLGIQEFRYSVPWHKIEKNGKCDWSLLDEMIAYAVGDLKLKLIADTLHHNPPLAYARGILNTSVVSAYPDYVQEFTERYKGSIYKFVPFNEPITTMDFCGRRGWWPPYIKQEKPPIQMLINSIRFTADAIRRVRAIDPGIEVLHVDTCERHQALDADSQDRAFFLNEWRFIFDELLLGRVDETHSQYQWLMSEGFPEELLQELSNGSAAYDVRGLDFYKICEEQLEGGETRYAPSREPLGFAGVALEYYERLKLPLRLTETNIQGFISDRITWLKYMREQYEKLRSMLPKGMVRGFDWYPLFDCKGWFVLLQGEEWPWDPQGIFYCDEGGDRHSSELSHWYRHLAQGGASSDIPAYEFQPQIKEEVTGFLKDLNWNWVPAVEKGDPAMLG